MLTRWRVGLALAPVLVVAAVVNGVPAYAAYTVGGRLEQHLRRHQDERQRLRDVSGGSISGGISGDEGRTNKGTWQESSTNGNYEFHMSESGRSFDGTYERSEGGCVFPPCDWDGQCISGPCLQNSSAEAGIPAVTRRTRGSVVARSRSVST